VAADAFAPQGANLYEIKAEDFASSRILISSSNRTTIVVTLPSVAGSFDVAAALAKNGEHASRFPPRTCPSLAGALTWFAGSCTLLFCTVVA
jgi:hypothetical protein